MMKWLKNKKRYFPLIALIFLLLLSWVYLQKAQESSNEELHGLLQEKVQMTISNYVEKKNPHIESITFHKIWTKNTNSPSDIKVFFTYSVVTGKKDGASLLADGEALLSQSSKNEDHWVLSNFKVTSSFLDFSEPMLIKASPQK